MAYVVLRCHWQRSNGRSVGGACAARRLCGKAGGSELKGSDMGNQTLNAMLHYLRAWQLDIARESRRLRAWPRDSVAWLAARERVRGLVVHRNRCWREVCEERKAAASRSSGVWRFRVSVEEQADGSCEIVLSRKLKCYGQIQ